MFYLLLRGGRCLLRESKSGGEPAAPARRVAPPTRLVLIETRAQKSRGGAEAFGVIAEAESVRRWTRVREKIRRGGNLLEPGRSGEVRSLSEEPRRGRNGDASEN